MAENLTAILNILLIPFISLFILYKKNCKNLGTRFEIIMKYAILTVLISIATECVAYVLLALFEKEITAYSSYYTVIATAAALVIPYAIRAIKVKVEYKKDKDTKEKSDEEKEPEEK